MKTLLILAFATIAYADERVATVLLRPDPKFAEKNVSGILKFVQADDNSPVIITGTIKGLKDSGSHGFHVHAKGDITGGCSSTGPHFNPKGVQHGAPTDAVRHVGDLGNIVANSNGEANINITDKIISLSGSNGIIGRAIVVHSGTDDLGKGGNATSLETGNAGDRWACGVIGVA